MSIQTTADPEGATPADSERLLSGITVLDFTNVLSGPFATYQLSLFGAEVIKVERPGVGDLARKLGADPELNAAGAGASFLAQNSGKKSITVDLKSLEGLRLIKKIVAEVDVVVENFRPGVMTRLGLGWEDLEKVNPSLVYCSISGYGQTGPLRDAPAYDQIIQGKSGMMATTGLSDSGPLRAGFPIADTLGGMAAAFGVSSAIVRREQTGKGAYLDVSMLESAMTAMGWVVSNYLVTGNEPARLGNDNFTASPSGAFVTADGQINIAANEDRQFAALCHEMTLDYLLADTRFATRQARLIHRDKLREILTEKLIQHSTSHWVSVLSAAGVPAGEVASVSEALSSEQVESRSFVQEVAQPESLDNKSYSSVLTSPIMVDGNRYQPLGHAPRLSQDTEEILESLGLSRDDIRALRRDEVV